MKEEAVSSSHDTQLPPKSSSPPTIPTPAASSVGASSPAVPTNAGGTDWFAQAQGSKAASLSRIGSQPMWTSVSNSAGGYALGSLQPSCRPWERGDLLRRLSTFQPTNWFGKPKASSSLACARRGWVNVDVDTIECEACGANLRFISKTIWTPDEAEIVGEEFAKKLDEEHRATCPWRGNSCAESLVQFPPTPPSALIGGYKDRCDGLLQFPSLPIVAASAIEHIRLSRSSEIERLLAQSSALGGMDPSFRLEIMSGTETDIEDVFLVYSRAKKLISLCGWEPRWLPNVQDCEEHSAQSARSGYSIGPTKYHTSLQDFGHGENVLPSSKEKNYNKNESVGPRSKGESRSPLLDCSLCGATVRIWDFLTVVRPSCFAPNSNDIPETSKKMALTRGVSAASGISGWVAADSVEKEQTEDLDEDATNEEGKSLSNIGVDLNLTMAGGLSSSQVNMDTRPEQFQDVHKRRYLVAGKPSSSEFGGQAASYESRGPSSRKRNLEEGGSTVDRPQLPVQPADSVEGIVIDRDGDEVNDGSQYSAGPSKRPCQSDAFGTHYTSYGKDSSGAGPSLSLGFEIGFGRRYEQLIGMPSTRESTHASSVIAMDTVHSTDDSMESVENLPGDFDDVHFPSTPMLRSADPVETSELIYSNQAQQSTCPAVVRSAGEIGVSSTNDEEVVNADTATANVRDGPSFGISGGSIGMGASHEAEIHGTDASVHRADSIAVEVEAVAEITENQGQTGEFAPDPGLMGDYVPEEVDHGDPNGDSQDLTSRSVGRADSGSKIVGSAKAESFESGEKTCHMQPMPPNSPHPSISCNAVVCYAHEASREEITQNNAPATDDCGFIESGYMLANGTAYLPGLPIGESNYEEAVEFDPIKHHNFFCPWINGNVAVAAAGCSSSGSSSSNTGAIAHCGWQLTLDALDSFQSLGYVPVQTVESESAASLYKDDHRAPGRKLLANHSLSKHHGHN